MLLFIYQIFFILGLGPYLAFRFFTKKKSDLFFKHRLGFGIKPQDSNKKIIWIHAVSLGEMKAAVPIFKKLKKQFPKKQFVVTASTKTGLEEAKKDMLGCSFGLLPYDLGFAIKRFLNRTQPEIALFFEGDLWPNLLHHLVKRKIPIFLINAQMSDRSFRRFRLIPFLAKKIFSSFDTIFAQSQIHKERFETFGAKNVVISSNIKLANVPKASDFAQYKREDFGIAVPRKVLILGSTHEGEEEILLNAIDPLIEKENLFVFIVPRHPERFSIVEELLKFKKHTFGKYSEIPKHNMGSYSIILVDQMGLLQNLYSLSDFAIVGGSFIKGVGGHNILEPIFAGSAVAFGPYMEAQQELLNIVLRHEAGIQLDSEILKQTLERVLFDQVSHKQLVQKGEKLLHSFQGLLDPILKSITHTLTS